MTRSRDMASLINANAAGKNFCINGGMDIWQRGISFSNSGGGQYTADRWQVYNGGGSYTAERTTSNIPSNFNYGIKVTATANSTVAYIMQMVETQNTTMLMGKNIIMGAWVQASAGTTINIQVLSSTTVDASIFNMNGNVTGTSSFTATGSLQFIYTNSGVIASNAKSLRLDVWVSSMSSGQSYTVTGVQLEAGSSTTPFSRAGGDIQRELDICQRYYWQGSGFQQASGMQTTANEVSVMFPLNLFNPIPMRATPTPSITGTSYITDFNSNLRTVTGLAMVQTSLVRVNYDSTKLTSATPYGVNVTGAGASFIFSAEL